MTVAPGTRLGSYEITAKLGEGGMGEVWRARDSQLGRDVALKLLPEQFTQDPERLARFEREAKLLAQLNHPNIAQIYGFEASGDARALVMELVEGPTLAERLEAGALPFSECLSVASQIAQALEEAHEKGIVHRDLKPQNVKASMEGKVKVLDFGLAKAMDPTGVASGPGSASQLAQSPTLTLGATQLGVILGTAAYMSPEQAKGLAVDKRADIWAFGVVLYEMLSRRRLFDGETVPETLAGVIRAEIDLSKLPESTPPALRRLLRRCLERNPKNRLRDIGEARFAIAEAEREAAEPAVAPAAAPGASRSSRALVALAVLGALAAGGLGLLAGRRSAGSEAPEFPRARAEVPPPKGSEFSVPDGPVVLSPDGRRLAFVLRTEGQLGVWVRDLDATEARLVPGTEDGYEPFWSPDGRSLGICSLQLLRWDLGGGGPPIPLVPMQDERGASWGRRGVIVYAPDALGSLMAVPAAGGTPRAVTQLDAGHAEQSHQRPSFLPDGRHFIYWAQSTRPGESAIVVGDLDSAATKRILPLEVPARFGPPSSLLYLRGDTLYAQPFDASRMEISGEASPVTGGVEYIDQYQNPAFSASDNGILGFHLKGEIGRPTWFDRAGRSGDSFGLAGDANLDLAPDGKRLAVNALDPATKKSDIWVIDLERNVRTRVTFEPTMDEGPVWARDGERIFYVSRDGEKNTLRVRRASGVGDATDLLAAPYFLEPIAAFPDGRKLLIESHPPGSHGDLEVVIAESGERQRYIGTPAHEESGRISPDGQLVAYTSDEAGQDQVYVQPYPPTGERWQISDAGGTSSRWSGDGRELFYVEGGRQLRRVAVERTPRVAFGKPEPLFRVASNDFVAAADGQQFLFIAAREVTERASIQLLFGWNRVPAGARSIP